MPAEVKPAQRSMRAVEAEIREVAEEEARLTKTQGLGANGKLLQIQLQVMVNEN